MYCPVPDDGVLFVVVLLEVAASETTHNLHRNLLKNLLKLLLKNFRTSSCFVLDFGATFRSKFEEFPS